MNRVQIEGIMTRDPITVHPDFTIEETAEILREYNISGCPVLDYQEQLTGIITKERCVRSHDHCLRHEQERTSVGFHA